MLRLIEAGEKVFSHLLNPNTSDFEQNICAQKDQLSNPYQFMDHADIEKDLTAINDRDDPKFNSDDLLIHANFVDQTNQIQYRDIAINTMSDEYYEMCLSQATPDQQKVINVLFSCFDKLNNSISSQTPHQPLYLFIFGGGDGGTGKSFLIHLAREIIIRKTRKNSVLVTAPTGCAAHNVNGQTLHSAFKLQVQHPKVHNLKNDIQISYSVRDELQKLYHDVKFIIIDEISMVSDFMFHSVHHRLNEIKCIDNSSATIFGGCSVIAFGDFFQLQPVAARYIFETALYGYYNLWITYFQAIFLSTNVRQSNDPIYAQLLSRVRIGNPTHEDIKILEQRTKVLNDVEPFTNAIRLFPTRLQCAEYNNERLQKLSQHSQTNMVKIEAMHSSQNSNLLPEHLIPSVSAIFSRKC